MRPTQLAAPKNYVRSATGAAVRLVRYGIMGPDERAVGSDGHRNCNGGVRHGMKR
jgi:hypothetical protein